MTKESNFPILVRDNSIATSSLTSLLFLGNIDDLNSGWKTEVLQEVVLITDIFFDVFIIAKHCHSMTIVTEHNVELAGVFLFRIGTINQKKFWMIVIRWFSS